MRNPKKIEKRLAHRKEKQTLRGLGKRLNLIDFSSNDYLGFAKSASIFDRTHKILVDQNIRINGATGSRLLSGNHLFYEEVEDFLCEFHQSEVALIFTSGYDANLGFFSSVPQRGDIILYDEFIHASIRDGIRLSMAKSYKFVHHNLENLDFLLARYSQFQSSEIYVVTESVFSMDGDSPNLTKMAEICKKHHAFLVVDEAHAVGIFGSCGQGKVQSLDLQEDVFARIITFGKAMGCHGAAILSSKELKLYLINFARSFIYTTGLAPYSLVVIKVSYHQLQMSFRGLKAQNNHQKLIANIQFFQSEIKRLQFSVFSSEQISKSQWGFIKSDSAIHCCVISGAEKVKKISQKLQKKGFDVRAILSPTVPENQERLRFCLHSYNSIKEISEVLYLLATFAKE